MPSFFKKLTNRFKRKSQDGGASQPAASTTDAPPAVAAAAAEPTYSIQPHPATTNDPADLQPKQPGGGLATSDPTSAFHARDPYVPSQEILKGLEPPLGRDELRARATELNQQAEGSK
ncbi:hypothetical protein H0H81_000452 [Sphagnurus paluster]|uniref:Uncharacterized protein n=1 Tax=Sphagnurus paluster TaxID=117069 RepID=A0A9P7K4I2_9AGAR|nr:hypothetical protein H0H81_000452 [Sphagnurus paluster]